MSNKYRLSLDAIDDLESIYDYGLEEWSFGQSEKYIEALFLAFDYISDDPDRGRSMQHLQVGFMRLQEGQHYIFYDKSDLNKIEILRILHIKMDLFKFLGY